MMAKFHGTLAGGTALALQIGHRISHDLDFFTVKDFSVDAAIVAVKKSGLPFRVTSEGDGRLNAEIDGIKVSLFRYDHPFVEKPLVVDGIQISGILDIAAMKVIAISQRGLKRDFVDLFYILREKAFQAIAELMVRRYGAERVPVVHIGKSLVYFADADGNPEPAYIEGRAAEWEEVKKFFRQHVRQFVFELDLAVRKGNK
ncbi:MAG TPA: nucleotidyl transferase AbiEii/AbiGii toxin family protein [Geobacteraceae bacterium]|nr:nucleotidyl transferase AbiEii/AbiGii toxin family protein [Geobacteraceae bacterium]